MAVKPGGAAAIALEELACMGGECVVVIADNNPLPLPGDRGCAGASLGGDPDVTAKDVLNSPDNLVELDGAIESNPIDGELDTAADELNNPDIFADVADGTDSISNPLKPGGELDIEAEKVLVVERPDPFPFAATLGDSLATTLLAE